MSRFSGLKTACIIFVVCVATAIASPAQGLFTLNDFSGADGAYPQAGVVQATDGNFYGTTYYGGSNSNCQVQNGCGTVFKITTSGTLTTLHSFSGSDGSGPESTLVQGTDGYLYGTTQGGGANNDGTVFKITLGGTLTTLHAFLGTDGASPQGGVVQATDGNFYGTTASGGAYNDGTVFKITPAGTLTTLHSFAGTDGMWPGAGLIQATDGNFYGTTFDGGSSSNSNCENGCGTVFKITPAGTLTTLHSFAGTDGMWPGAGLVQATDGNFYGTTEYGGVYGGIGNGTVFKITPSGTLTKLYSFCAQPGCTDGELPAAGLVQATDGNLYGTTYYGGSNSNCQVQNGCGTVFKITKLGTLTTLYSFFGPDGSHPYAGLVQGADGNLYGTTQQCEGADGTVFVLTVGLQPLTTLFSFDWTDGAEIEGGLVQAIDGNLYGTTLYGGANNEGTAFRITSAGTMTTVYNFCAQTNCSDGSGSTAAMVQGTDGNLYGTTETGGAYGYGTVFKMSTSGTLTTLYSFCAQSGCPDGSYPSTGLVQATDGNFYGTASGGSYSVGTVFKITPAGALTTIYSFCAQSGCPDGAGPKGLVQAPDGNFYGTTNIGGAYNYGTVFRMTLRGTLTTLHSFTMTDGAYPSGLVQAIDGNLYGTTYEGGANQCDYGAGPVGCGTVFKINTGGTLTTLQSFNETVGYNPLAGLVQATDGNFYGTTWMGGASVYSGTVFKITPAGTLTVLHSFCSQTNCADGTSPNTGLIQATDGNLYGTTYQGGTGEWGTVFKLSLGMGPFVETLSASGTVGAPIIILGSNLTGTTKVGFAGTAATFTVASGSEITTTVPAGAITGTVAVLTPSGWLKSNVPFRVKPQIMTFSPGSGAVGTVVTITGVSLTQTKAVAFGGVPATQFTVISDTDVQVTVPTGATTGHVAILTPGGIATSGGIFTVTQ